MLKPSSGDQGVPTVPAWGTPAFLAAGTDQHMGGDAVGRAPRCCLPAPSLSTPSECLGFAPSRENLFGVGESTCGGSPPSSSGSRGTTHLLKVLPSARAPLHH